MDTHITNQYLQAEDDLADLLVPVALQRLEDPAYELDPPLSADQELASGDAYLYLEDEINNLLDAVADRVNHERGL